MTKELKQSDSSGNMLPARDKRMQTSQDRCKTPIGEAAQASPDERIWIARSPDTVSRGGPRDKDFLAPLREVAANHSRYGYLKLHVLRHDDLVLNRNRSGCIGPRDCEKGKGAGIQVATDSPRSS